MNPLEQYFEVKAAQEKLAHPLDKATGIKRVGQLLTGSRLPALKEQAEAAHQVVGAHGLPVGGMLKGIRDEASKVNMARNGAATVAGAAVGGTARAVANHNKQQKTAGAIGNFASGMAQGARRVVDPHELGRIGGQAALVGGAGLLVGAAQKTYLAITKARDFDAMLKHNPDLADRQAANPEQFNQHYTSLRTMNPMFAKDPVVAGSYMRQMSMNPATAGKVLVESLNSLKSGPKGGGFGEGLKAMQSNASMGLSERGHALKPDQYEQQLADKQRRAEQDDAPQF